MNVKQRIISLKFVEKEKNHSEFLEEIGVVATIKEKHISGEVEEVHGCYKREDNYDKLDS